MSKAKIGGFFELFLPPESAGQRSLAKHWKLPDNPAFGFVNARSALAALLAAACPPKIWLPAYICESVVEGVRASGVSFAFYPVGKKLEPDVAFLEKETKAAEAVLAVNYFGRAPDAAFLTFAQKHDDLLLIEDCAQTLDTGMEPWGHWRLFSPRKLVGVADGGYAVPTGKGKQITFRPSPSPHENTDMWLAPLARFENPDDNKYWHALNQEKEKAMTVSNLCVSRLSHELLQHCDVAEIIRRRQRNYATLFARLSAHAFLAQNASSFCPLGFPLRLNPGLRSIVRDRLIEQHVFAAIHWMSLPSPEAEFSDEHQLSQELLTLPCDHRYGDAEMEFVAQIVLDGMGDRA